MINANVARINIHLYKSKFHVAFLDNRILLYFLCRKSVDNTVNKDAANCNITPGHITQYNGMETELFSIRGFLGNVKVNDLNVLA